MVTVSDIKNIVPCLRGYSRALTGNAEIADGHVEVCLYTAMENYDGVSQNGLRIWLFTLLHDVIVGAAPSGPQVRKATAPARAPPSGTHVADSREPGLQLAFHSLSFAQKAVLFLMAVEEFSDQEAAIITRMTVRTVREALREALDQLSALSLGFLTLREVGSK